MSYDTCTIFVDIETRKIINVGIGSSVPSLLMDIAIAYREYLRQPDCCDFWWVPKGEVVDTIDLDAYNAIAICCIDYSNPMCTAIAGATYNVCCGCHPIGDIREKLFPQNCELVYNFERRIKDYLKSKRKIDAHHLVKLLTK